MYKVLIIEDDVMMNNMLSMYLTEEGYEVQQAFNGTTGLHTASHFSPHIILLDLILPDINGIAICSEIRLTSNVPIMILSMKSEVSERVLALKAGADDYLCKPFSMHELTARVEALIRRSIQTIDQLVNSSRMEVAVDGDTNAIRLDHERRLLIVREEPVETTFSEYEIMRLFLSTPNKVFSREELISTLRGFDSFVTDRSIDVHIVNLRKKIEQNPREPKLIKTVWGFGYKYSPTS
ncbi:MAG: response regulator transcription factor [Candidatus Pristimantibacillus lignocellulolyticus]|uniref:Response regulator transcription factor n=1 Tax=Candidatus Pristimantibacillus lignocellulolyticus TaxID=2994561 RepID=A0A9J6ZGJ4_9BACL|nr:MAG: response regulator transcription factor [Candidatus Pristimantibacillus lignocellulolyticus]